MRMCRCEDVHVYSLALHSVFLQCCKTKLRMESLGRKLLCVIYEDM